MQYSISDDHQQPRTACVWFLLMIMAPIPDASFYNNADSDGAGRELIAADDEMMLVNYQGNSLCLLVVQL